VLYLILDMFFIRSVDVDDIEVESVLSFIKHDSDL